MSKTKDNLSKALAGESRTYVRYRGFAEKAEEEGCLAVARLFRAAAESEMVHARSLQCALGAEHERIESLKSAGEVQTAIEHLKSENLISGTVENLEKAIEGETYEFKKLYPAMIKDAVAEKETQARYSFEYAMSCEMVHAQLFKKALKDPNDNTEADYYVCPVCGYTVMAHPPGKCPYCGMDAKKFTKVN